MLSEVTGVNKLAKEQSIIFALNLTLIYRENGTGKTGYGRILKAPGFSYDQNNTILSNIFEAINPRDLRKLILRRMIARKYLFGKEKTEMMI